MSEVKNLTNKEILSLREALLDGEKPYLKQDIVTLCDMAMIANKALLKPHDIFGAVFTEIKGMESGCDEVYFTSNDGRKFKMYHSQSCYESVSLNEVIGDVNDLLNSPIISYSCETNSEDDTLKEYTDESFTWTFYKFQTMKGNVTLRWYGSSNGYYSEDVSFKLIDGDHYDWNYDNVICTNEIE